MPAADVNDLRRERSDCAAQARSILDTAQDAERDMSGEEEQTFDRLIDRVDQIDTEITRRERLAAIELDGDPEPPDPRSGTGTGDEDQQRSAAFRAYLTGGRAALSEEQVRSLVMGSDPEGGYLMAPPQFVTELLQAVDDEVQLRRVATVDQITEAESLGQVSLDDDLADAEWTSELSSGSDDESLRFGRRKLTPSPLAKRVKVSRTLLRRSPRNPEELVRQRMAHKFAVTEEKAFISGDGNEKPLGLFVPSTDGISTARDVVTGSATGFTGDGLIDAKYSLKPQYWRRARWLFHRFALRDLRKLKSTDDQYLWQPGLAGDRPDTILDIPYLVSEFVPSTIADGEYVGMLGDFTFYWIVESLRFEVQRLVELYAERNQVGFIGRAEVDAMPTLEEAFVRLKVGT